MAHDQITSNWNLPAGVQAKHIDGPDETKRASIADLPDHVRDQEREKFIAGTLDDIIRDILSDMEGDWDQAEKAGMALAIRYRDTLKKAAEKWGQS